MRYVFLNLTPAVVLLTSIALVGCKNTASSNNTELKVPSPSTTTSPTPAATPLPATPTPTPTPVNQAPVANALLVTAPLSQLVVTGTLAGSVSDPEGQPLTFEVTRQPYNGTLSIDAGSGSFTYTKNSAEVYHDTFTYRVKDGEMYSQSNTVTIQDVNGRPRLETLLNTNGTLIVRSYTAIQYWIPANGAIYIAGAFDNNRPNDFTNPAAGNFIAKLSSDGHLLWSHVYSKAELGLDVLDISELKIGTNNLFLVHAEFYVYTASDLEGHVIAFDMNGVLRYKVALEGNKAAVAERSDGALIACADVLNPLGNSYASADITCKAWNTSGVLLWNRDPFSYQHKADVRKGKVLANDKFEVSGMYYYFMGDDQQNPYDLNCNNNPSCTRAYYYQLDMFTGSGYFPSASNL